MWTLSRDGWTDYLLAEPTEPLGEGDEVRSTFFDVAAARRFLRALPQQVMVEESLLTFAWERLYRAGARFERRHEIVEAVATALAHGGLVIVARAVPEGGGVSRVGEEEVLPLKGARDESATMSWIEIELVDELDRPVPAQRFAITAPDGAVIEGVLGIDGRARVALAEKGMCRVSFVDLDEELWTSAS